MTISERYGEYLNHFGETIPVNQFVAGLCGKNPVILRHDIDYTIDVALEMAEFEHRHGCRSTFYVLHTADYMNDPLLFEKCLQIQDYGHEIGIHLNYLTQWFAGEISDVGEALQRDLKRFRSQGLDVRSVAAHGDRACYERGFTNYWLFSDLRPEDPLRDEGSVTAEGIRATTNDRTISYPSTGHHLTRDDGATFDLWSLKLADFDLECEASRLDIDNYFTDSGGSWKRSPNPIDAPVPDGRTLVLMHPLYYRGEQKLYYILSTARSGSKWLATFLDEATSVTARHEYTLNHVMRKRKLVPDKRTGAGFTSLLEDKAEAQHLIQDACYGVSELWTDYAEANIYLEQFFDQLPQDHRTTFIHLHRDPHSVARSLLERNWYDVSPDDRHPPVNVEGWDTASQVEQICWYIRDVNSRLLQKCDHFLQFEKMVSDEDYLTEFLSAFGIVVYPRLAKRVMGRVVNNTTKWTVPAFNDWRPEDRAAFAKICAPVAKFLGYDAELSDDYIKMGQARAGKRGKPVVPPLETLLTMDVALQPGRISVKHCQLKLIDNKLELLFDNGAHGNAMLGSGYWRPDREVPMPYRASLVTGISPDVATAIGGWPTNGERTYTLGLRATLRDPTVSLRVICVSYDAHGVLVSQRDLATLSSDRPEAKINFQPARNSTHFNVALYMAKGPGDRTVIVDDIAMASMPWAKARGVTPTQVLEKVATEKVDTATSNKVVFRGLNASNTGANGSIAINAQDAGRAHLRITPINDKAPSVYLLSGSWLQISSHEKAFDHLKDYTSKAISYALSKLPFSEANSNDTEQKPSNGAVLAGHVTGEPLSQSEKVRVYAYFMNSAGSPQQKVAVGVLSATQATVSFRLPVGGHIGSADIGLELASGAHGVDIHDAILAFVD